MQIDDAFPSNYLKAADLNGRAIRATIAGIEIKDVGGQGKAEDHKPVISFQGDTKDIVLNKTNAGVLKERYGGETTSWIGKPVDIRPDKTHFQGRLVDCIRLGIPPIGDPSVGGMVSMSTLIDG